MDLEAPPPSPGTIPDPPVGTEWKYTIDFQERVVRADLSGDRTVLYADKQYILRLFERPDITVVIRGLTTGLDATKWSLPYLTERCGDCIHNTIRRFTLQEAGGNFVEEPTAEKAWVSMRIKDFIRQVFYLSERDRALRCSAPTAPVGKATPKPGEGGTRGSGDMGGNGKAANAKGRDGQGRDRGRGQGRGRKESDYRPKPPWGPEGFVRAEGRGGKRPAAAMEDEARAGMPSSGRLEMDFIDGFGLPARVRLLEEALYMTDFDLTRYMPELCMDLSRNFKLDTLPGGANCALQNVAQEARPFMGPNLYISPPGR
ncbi:unnamed protein product [Discosporangium mesarthrocarpum]